jgi:plastocyanin
MRRSRFLRILLPLAVVALFALASGAALATGHTVKATSGNAWNPAKTTVTRGGRVTWSNPTYQDHPIVAYGGNWAFSKSLSHGGAVSRTFNSADTFKFRCTLHSYMSGGVCHGICGRVVVQ